MSGNGRRIACVNCRERKVKCDGQQPACQKCVDSKVECKYARPKRGGKENYQAAFTIIYNRLLQAETALAAQQDAPVWTNNVLPAMTFEHKNSWAPSAPEGLPSTAGAPFTSHNLTSNLAEDAQIVNLGNIGPVYAPVAPNTPWTPALTDFCGRQIAAIKDDAMHFTDDTGDLSEGIFTTSPSTNISNDNSSLIDIVPGQQDVMIPDSPPPNVINDLNLTFFNQLKPCFPIIDQPRFSLEHEELMTPESIALRHAMWAHAATLHPQYIGLSEKLYSAAKEASIRFDLEENSTSSIIVLQTCALLALYELKKGNFGKACINISRANCLCQLLELHKLDQVGTLKNAREPATASNVEEVEEKRKTFWAVFTLNCFLRLTNWANLGVLSDHKEITTLLCSGNMQDSQQTTSLSLTNAMKLSSSWILSAQQGMLVVIGLASEILMHVRKLHHDATYDFWTKQHHLEELLQHAQLYSLEHLKPMNFSLDPNVVSLNIILEACIICLFSAAICKIETTGMNFYTSRSQQSWDTCGKALESLTSMARRLNKINFPKLHLFLPWALFVALQALLSWPIEPPQSNSTSASPVQTPSVRGKISSPGHKSRLSHSCGPLRDAHALDSIRHLRSALEDMGSNNAIARVLLSQSDFEPREGNHDPRKGAFGLVEFPIKWLDSTNCEC